MTSTCCRCAVACSIVASLAAAPARAQSPVVPGAAGFPATQTAPTSVFSAKPKSSFSDLFRATVDDLRAIPTRDNLFIVGLGGLTASLAHPADPRVSNKLSSSPSLGTVFSAGETLGGAAAQMAGAIATQMIGRAAGSPRVSALGADLVRAQLVTQTLTAGIKLSVRRTRPDGTQYSFPSGHASTTFATATVLQRHYGWKAGVPAYAFATYVAASRVQVKRHYLSDVAMGAALGIVAGRSVTLGRGDARFALGPSVVPGGAGVGFTWLGRK